MQGHKRTERQKMADGEAPEDACSRLLYSSMGTLYCVQSIIDDEGHYDMQQISNAIWGVQEMLDLALAANLEATRLRGITHPHVVA